VLTLSSLKFLFFLMIVVIIHSSWSPIIERKSTTVL
jgi:hypothetical protein